MAKSYIEKMEEAAGITAPKPKVPYGKGERVAQGGVARPWIGPRPWRDVPLTPRAKGGPVSPGRSKVMKMKGTPLAGFMPAGGKKAKRAKKRMRRVPV